MASSKPGVTDAFAGDDNNVGQALVKQHPSVGWCVCSRKCPVMPAALGSNAAASMSIRNQANVIAG
jgi:hypothetical protein